MTHRLTPEQEKFVQQQVAAGAFDSPEEVIASALSDMQEKEAYKIWLNEKLKEAEADIAAGRVHTPSEAWAYVMSDEVIPEPVSENAH